MTVVGVTIPRNGSSPEENEDAMRWRIEGGNLVACVSDGATESVYSRTWAAAVADGFVRDAPADGASFKHSLRAWQERWRTALPSGQQPWYVSNRIEEGSHAAFIGIVVKAGVLNAFAIGDCCILRDVEGAPESWPITDPDAFDDRPDLVGTEGPAGDALVASWSVGTGERILLASDAAAEWLLRVGLDGVTAEDLPDRIIQARRDRSLRNDDTSILIVDL